MATGVSVEASGVLVCERSAFVTPEWIEPGIWQRASDALQCSCVTREMFMSSDRHEGAACKAADQHWPQSEHLQGEVLDFKIIVYHRGLIGVDSQGDSGVSP